MESAPPLPYEPEWSKAVYHLFVVRVANREVLMTELAAAGIGSGIHYPVPLHLQKAYKNLGYLRGDFPVTEHVSAEIVSLPMFPHVRAEQIRETVSAVLSQTPVVRLA
jgi:dTDP-4-amino-4,6-dideoxygalactose transaminase